MAVRWQDPCFKAFFGDLVKLSTVSMTLVAMQIKTILSTLVRPLLLLKTFLVKFVQQCDPSRLFAHQYNPCFYSNYSLISSGTPAARRAVKRSIITIGRELHGHRNKKPCKSFFVVNRGRALKKKDDDDNRHPCYGKLTAVKTRYPLYSIT